MKLPNVRNLPVSDLRWVDKAQRYQRKDGKFVSGKTVRAIVDQDIEVRGKRMAEISQGMQDITDRYLSGKLKRKTWEKALNNWHDAMLADIKPLHLANAAAACGGFHNMKPRDWGRAGAAIGYNKRKLANWRDQILAQPELASSDGVDGRLPFMRRQNLYSEAGRISFEAVRRLSMQDAGFKYESNVLEPEAHHCVGDDSCKAQTERGIVPIGELLLPGYRICQVACKCSMDYYRTKKG